ncbi:replication protein A 70 kDa DNA-binding subunit-like [Saccostrea cucullata]|uniref:replication protein A 70 kDa DNA-binding subunit-like n=1 Tax=Saccostrea cuccullata TaxID=36930 RepID=UPI002ED43138
MEATSSVVNLKPGYSNLCIKVLTKSDVKTSAKDVKYGVLHLSDETGTVRATCFGDKTTDILGSFEVGQVYKIKNVYIKNVPEQYIDYQKLSTVKVEINITDKSVIEHLPAVELLTKQKEQEFLNIKNIFSMKPNSLVNLCAVPIAQGEIFKIESKNLQCREVTLIDNSNCSCKLSLFEDDVNRMVLHQPVEIHDAKIKIYKDQVSLTTSTRTKFISTVNKRLEDLKLWFETCGSDLTVPEQSCEPRTKEIKITDIPSIEVPFLKIKFVAKIFGVRKDNTSYQGCPNPSCHHALKTLPNKKLFCYSCGKAYSKACHRYKNFFMLKDNDSEFKMGATGFDMVGKKLFGIECEEFVTLEECDQRALLESVVGDIYVFECSYTKDSKSLTITSVQERNECQELLTDDEEINDGAESSLPPPPKKLYRPWSLDDNNNDDEPCHKVQRTDQRDTPVKNEKSECDSVKRKLFQD